MSSEWFIFKGTHHIGPFTSSDIEMMYKRGDIDKNVLIWKEGESSWEPLHKNPSFQQLFNERQLERTNEATTSDKINFEDHKNGQIKKLPKPLKTNLKEVENSRSLELMEDELPPPLPLDVFAFEHKKEEEAVKPPKLKKFSGVKNQDASKFLLGGIAIISMGLFIWHLLNESKSDIEFKIKDLMPVYKEQLTNAAQEVSLEPKIKMALAMSGHKVYFATNLSNELDVSVRLASIKDRTLGANTGVMYLRGKVFNHLGEFNKVYLTNGQIFSPGEFNYEVHIVEKHFLNTYFPVLSNIPFIRKLNHRYSLNGKELLYASSPKEFEVKLKLFQSEQKEKLTRPITEVIEKLATINGLCEQGFNKLSDVLKVAKTGKELKAYGDFYFKNIAPVMQSLVFDEKSNLGKYNEYIKEASSVLSSPLSDGVKAIKFKGQDKNKFLMEFKAKIETIKMKIAADQSLLNDQLKNL